MLLFCFEHIVVKFYFLGNIFYKLEGSNDYLCIVSIRRNKDK
jgi:hypothetical protein